MNFHQATAFKELKKIMDTVHQLSVPFEKLMIKCAQIF